MILRSPLLSSIPGLVHGFTTRIGGRSRGHFASLNVGTGLGDDDTLVAENRRLVAVEAGLPSVYMVSQVHGSRLIVVGRSCTPEETATEEADALASTEPGRAVAVRTADCLPILLADPEAGVVAAIHAGWRGTVAGVAAGSVDLLRRRLGLDPARAVAALGPCIRPCCFEVGEEVARKVGESWPRAVCRRGDLLTVDLACANGEALVSAGLAPERVDDLGLCTACDSRRFFSHRRDRGTTGRQMSYVALAR
ncbi:MAG: peptidoglycan editing factor PgeF [Myxococcota bacterium]